MLPYLCSHLLSKVGQNGSTIVRLCPLAYALLLQVLGSGHRNTRFGTITSALIVCFEDSFNLVLVALER